MISATLSAFWAPFAADETAPAPPRKRPAPLFIGDAVQPFAGETLLLALLRADMDKGSENPPDP